MEQLHCGVTVFDPWLYRVLIVSNLLFIRRNWVLDNILYSFRNTVHVPVHGDLNFTNFCINDFIVSSTVDSALCISTNLDSFDLLNTVAFSLGPGVPRACDLLPGVTAFAFGLICKSSELWDLQSNFFGEVLSQWLLYSALRQSKK
jgi:hypothetical protein